MNHIIQIFVINIFLISQTYFTTGIPAKYQFMMVHIDIID